MYCPQCAKPGWELTQHKCLTCEHCGFTYFHNVATAVGALIVVDGQVMLIRRARDPGKGMLGVPGGFVDPFEHAEAALLREIKEEIGIDVTQPLHYLGGWANEYNYKDVKYHTQDFYYEIQLPQRPQLELEPKEVLEVVWRSKEELDLNELAFCSARDALAFWLDN